MEKPEISNYIKKDPSELTTGEILIGYQKYAKDLEKYIEEQLSIGAVSGSLLSEIRQAVADYMWSEGCDCCRSDNHDENGERLAVLLGVKKYEDGSGYDWESVRKK